MEYVCLDLEGVLVPEIWVEVAELTGEDQFKLTTQDLKDYSELMDTDPFSHIEMLGLREHLSSQRSNGLKSMIREMALLLLSVFLLLVTPLMLVRGLF